MWPFPNPLTLFGDAIGGVAGWAWDKVVQGIYTWFADGLLLLMEWVWRVLDTSTTPRLTDAWFTSGLVAPLAALAVAVTVALMLASAIQAGLAGRPELIADALKEGPKAIVATALTVTVMDVLVRGADVVSQVVWQAGRTDAQRVMDGLAATMSHAGGLASTFLGPLALLFGMIGLLVTTVVLFMRSSLLYLVAAFAPIVWASSVSPVLRGAGRRLVQVTVALVLAKPAIAVTLVVGVKLLSHAGATTAAGSAPDGAAALGTLVSGFACFAIAGLSPWVVYRLLPAVEGAAVASGIVSGWGRAGMSAVQAGLMVKSLGTTAASAATRAVPAGVAAAGSGTSGQLASSPAASATPGTRAPTSTVGRSGDAVASGVPTTFAAAAATRPPSPRRGEPSEEAVDRSTLRLGGPDDDTVSP
jgi:hypothetical protein